MRSNRPAAGASICDGIGGEGSAEGKANDRNGGDVGMGAGDAIPVELEPRANPGVDTSGPRRHGDPVAALQSTR